ncbi:Glycoside hydrolase family 5 protein [Rhodotorula toruloides ATCC 204091]|uniref:glucan 1,3-beta-glucosidase n=2 Tax=Rhodotorula toruloides TaxID=5286 RepID=A0A2T0ABY0_RHOTO|nr:Glycoside hydrolase family 5 protein [Rhodotorula toruloides ATCC 204091]KAK4330963.1 Sporulation-specific glucan 1,3-beta-glucosidase [Rhodotorula toruloides]PRQ75510.1 glycoside hydrolase family 5 protein [Rhodotorula toruloides]
MQPPSPPPHSRRPSTPPPPALPPKIAPPPPPAPPASHVVIPVTPTRSASQVVPVPTPPTPSTSTSRHRTNPSFFGHARAQSRSTSIDLTPSRTYALAGTGGGSEYEAYEMGAVYGSRGARERDLPNLPSSDDEEAEGLLGRTGGGRGQRGWFVNGKKSKRRRRKVSPMWVCGGATALVLLGAAGWWLFAPLERPTLTEGASKVGKATVILHNTPSLATSPPPTSAAVDSSAWEGGVAPGIDGSGTARWQTGGDGDTVLMSNGSSYIYRNALGGTFTSDPFSLSARPQRHAKSLAEEWDWQYDRIHGVNLGGWLTPEPFITPALFEPFLNATYPAEDEWTLSEALIREGGEARLEEVLRRHYDTFITEIDFAEIASAGLNWVRLPVPYWAIKKWEGEPFLEKVAWEYVLKAVEWARKYGLRINFDLHSVPGSQNGWNHSGRLGPIGFLHSPSGIFNAQRALDLIATIAEWSSRDGVKEVVGMLSIVNEPMLQVIGEGALRGFYLQAYETIRNITGYGSGPFLAFHDGFKGTRRWYHFLDTPSPDTVAAETPTTSGDFVGISGMDRVGLDSHRYLAFAEPDLRSVREQVMKPCLKWAPEFNKTMACFGIAISGEFALAVNDCGRFLNNVFQGSRLEGTFPNASAPMYPPSVPVGTCEWWEDYSTWTDDFKASLRDLALAQMDTFQNWFYWTWKTLPSTTHLPHLPANPLWSYSLGLKEGWIPTDPREAQGFCFAYEEQHPSTTGEAVKKRPIPGPTEGWKVGKSPEGETELPYGRIERALAADMHRAAWPPLEFDLASAEFNGGGLDVSSLPVYTRPPPSVDSTLALPGPVGSKNVDVAKALAEGKLRSWVEPIEGCEYPDRWARDEASADGGALWRAGMARPQCSVGGVGVA